MPLFSCCSAALATWYLFYNTLGKITILFGHKSFTLLSCYLILILFSVVSVYFNGACPTRCFLFVRQQKVDLHHWAETSLCQVTKLDTAVMLWWRSDLCIEQIIIIPALMCTICVSDKAFLSH